MSCKLSAILFENLVYIAYTRQKHSTFPSTATKINLKKAISTVNVKKETEA